MAIYKPEPHLLPEDARLLKLIAELILYQTDGDLPSNLVGDKKPLSDRQSKDLLELLESLYDRKDFRENMLFIEGVFDDSSPDERSYREIYLSRRKKLGHSRAMASMHWADFRYRLGKVNRQHWGSNVTPMEFRHFERMERRLFRELGINPRVSDLLMQMIEAQRIQIEQARNTTTHESKGLLQNVFKSTVSNLKKYPDSTMSVNRLSAIMTIVANTSVLYTTRD
ncbi:MAG: hypothetical protein HQ514_01545, partial [Rhodospirillales bacterium]|nr:hypothetical protein [Rhodospirillales bacterium]